MWVIPAKALGTAPSAPVDDNLKYLLAFAGAHLFCLVVFVWSFYHGSPLLLSLLLFGNPFTVGGLLGDVFLHLLPETYQHVREKFSGCLFVFENFRIHDIYTCVGN